MPGVGLGGRREATPLGGILKPGVRGCIPALLSPVMGATTSGTINDRRSKTSRSGWILRVDPGALGAGGRSWHNPRECGHNPGTNYRMTLCPSAGSVLWTPSGWDVESPNVTMGLTPLAAGKGGHNLTIPALCGGVPHTRSVWRTPGDPGQSGLVPGLLNMLESNIPMKEGMIPPGGRAAPRRAILSGSTLPPTRIVGSMRCCRQTLHVYT